MKEHEEMIRRITRMLEIMANHELAMVYAYVSGWMSVGGKTNA